MIQLSEGPPSCADPRIYCVNQWPSVKPGPAAKVGANFGSERILVVDDDPMIRESVAIGLRRSSYHVSCAADGEYGWQALCAEHFDALITDHEMPRLTGLALLRRVRARPLEIPVIITSGHLPWHEDDFPGLLVPGVALAKPFSLIILLENLRNILRRPEVESGFQ